MMGYITSCDRVTDQLAQWELTTSRFQKNKYSSYSKSHIAPNKS